MEGTDYLAHSGALQVGLSASRLELRLPFQQKDQALGISLANSNRQAPVVASERGTGESNYLLGAQASAWRTHVPQYQRLTYSGVYPGIDLTFYGKGEKLEHDFVVQPGADYHQIRLRYDGANRLTLSPDGNLHVELGKSEVLVRAPRIYQTENGRESDKKGEFVLLSKNEVGFRIGAFDPTLTLVIDPVLDYSTYLANLSLYVQGTAVDAAGNTYIVGLTFSSSYPVTSGAVQSTCGSCASNQPDIFITKLNAAGTAQVYSTFLGGNNYDQPSKITVDSNGNAIVVGYTESTNFPLKNPISAGTASSSNSDGFVVSLAPDGASLNFSSRLGGTDSQGRSAQTFPGAVAVDASGNVYVSGVTESSYLPTTAGALHAGTPAYSSRYVFLTKLQPAGSLAYSSILGATGSASQCCSVAGIAVDSTGNVYVAGTVGVTTFTSTTPWPITAGAYQSVMISPGDAAPFVAKVSADASSLLYSTLVATGITSGMALNQDKQVILVGTANYNYPVTSDAYSSKIGTSFIAKLSADASQLAYSTYFSTPTADTGGFISSVALDTSGNVWIAGNTQYSTNIPMVNPLQSLPGSSATSSGSAFVSEFDPQVHQLLFSTYFNGALGGSRISGLALDTQGRAHIAGTSQYDLPTTPSAYLGAVDPPPQNYTYTYGFAALINPTPPGPGICFSSAGTNAQVGSTGQAKVTVINCGNAPLNISTVQLTNSIFALTSSSNCIGTLGASASCTIPVNFTPTATGSFGASVVVTSNATVPVYKVSVSGLATAPTLTPLPSSVTFAPQVLGVSASGANIVFFASNTGSASLIVNTSLVTITGDFSIVSNDCGSPVKPPASSSSGFACTITVSFQPTALGTRTGTLTIPSNDPVHPITTVPLTGTAIGAYTAPTITRLLNPAVALGASAATLRVLGTNFFPTSYVTLNGQPLSTSYQGSTSLQVSIDPSILTIVGELPVAVVNPFPGGQSASVPLTVYRSLPISAANLIYEPISRLLYASIPASATTNPNSVISIDPQTGQTGSPISVGKNPGKLAVSSDGTRLYVGLNGDHALQRINLKTAQIEGTFALPVDSFSGATTIRDMQVVPDSSNSVVVSLNRPASADRGGAALYNDSGLVKFLSVTPPSNFSGIDSLAFANDPSTLYGFSPFGGFAILGVSPVSLTYAGGSTGTCCSTASGQQLVSDGSLLYTTSGQVWNPATRTLQGTYTPALIISPSVVPDTGLQRTFFLDTFSGYYNTLGYTNIVSYNQSSYAQAGSLSIPVLDYSSSADLLRWGADGFAFRVSSGYASDQIILLRSSIAQTATGGTPTLSTVLPVNVVAGSPIFSLTVNGSGFIPGSTVLWNGAARQTSYVSATQLIALIPASDVALTAAAQITVTNPAPGKASAALTFNVLGKSQTINFTAPVSPVLFGMSNVSLSATATSNLPVSFTVTGPATLAASSLQLTGAGTVVVTATQPGNSSFAAAAAVSRTILINPGTPTILLSSSANPVLAESAITLKATISSPAGTPTGTVNFLDGTSMIGSVAIANGAASLTTSTLSAGSHSITALYSGDANFVSLTSASLSETVQDFNLNISSTSGASTSQTVSAGGTATYALTFNPTGAATFPATVTLTVTGLPSGASYTLTPAAIVAGAGATNVALTIQVPARTASLEPHRRGTDSGFAPIALALLLLPFSRRLRRSANRLSGIISATLLLLACGALVSLVGCGGKGGGSSAQNPQSYTIVLTGTSGTLVHTTNLTLTVQ